MNHTATPGLVEYNGKIKSMLAKWPNQGKPKEGERPVHESSNRNRMSHLDRVAAKQAKARAKREARDNGTDST